MVLFDWRLTKKFKAAGFNNVVSRRVNVKLAVVVVEGKSKCPVACTACWRKKRMGGVMRGIDDERKEHGKYKVFFCENEIKEIQVDTTSVAVLALRCQTNSPD